MGVGDATRWRKDALALEAARCIVYAAVTTLAFELLGRRTGRGRPTA